jgi:hypothetical protein
MTRYPGFAMSRNVDQSKRAIQLSRSGLNRSTTASMSTHSSPSSSNRITPTPSLRSS